MFEHSLIGLEAKKPSRRAWFSLPVAIGLHVIAVATFTFAGTWNVPPVPEPMIVEPFMVQLPPPPPPILGSGRSEPETTAAVKPPAPVAPEQPIQPTQTADLDKPATTPSTVIDSVAGLPPNGDPRGSIYGVEHGDPDFGVDFSDGPVGPSVSVTPAPAPEMPERNEPIQVGGAVTRPVVVSRTEPRYTELARKARIEGVVIVKAVIDERGYVTDVQLVRGQPMGLDKAAMDAVKTWRFTPATLHGVPVKVYFNLTVSFTLQR